MYSFWNIITKRIFWKLSCGKYLECSCLDVTRLGNWGFSWRAGAWNTNGARISLEPNSRPGRHWKTSTFQLSWYRYFDEILYVGGDRGTNARLACSCTRIFLRNRPMLWFSLVDIVKGASNKKKETGNEQFRPYPSDRVMFILIFLFQRIRLLYLVWCHTENMNAYGFCFRWA